MVEGVVICERSLFICSIYAIEGWRKKFPFSHFKSNYFSLQIVTLLLQNGANPLLKNKSGKVPHEIVENEPIKEMLLIAVATARTSTIIKVEGDPLATYNADKVTIVTIFITHHVS